MHLENRDDGVMLRSALQCFVDVSAEGLVADRIDGACELLAVVAQTDEALTNLLFFANSSAVEMVADSCAGSLRFLIVESCPERLPHLMWAVEVLSDRLDFAGARAEDGMGPLSGSLFKTSLLGTDCISATDGE